MKYELDHAVDSTNRMRYFIVHGPLPKDLAKDAYGYPICDSMNRHHCISPEEDDAIGEMIIDSLNNNLSIKILASALKKFAPEAVEIILNKVKAEQEGYEEFLAFLRS